MVELRVTWNVGGCLSIRITNERDNHLMSRGDGNSITQAFAPSVTTPIVFPLFKRKQVTACFILVAKNENL